MVAVVAVLELSAGFLAGHILRVGQFLQLVFQISMDLFLGDAAYLHVAFVH